MTAPTPPTNIGNLTLNAFLSDLSAKEPTPGGGCASAVVAATGCALIIMAARFSRDSKSLAAHAPALDAMIAQFERALAVLSALADDDVAAYRAYRAARGERSASAQGAAAFQKAVRDAATVPLEIVATSAALLVATDEMKAHTSRHLFTDLAGGAQMLSAGARSAAMNVRINLSSLDDATFRAKLEHELNAAMARIKTAAKSIARHAEAQID